MEKEAEKSFKSEEGGEEGQSKVLEDQSFKKEPESEISVEVKQGLTAGAEGTSAEPKQGSSSGSSSEFGQYRCADCHLYFNETRAIKCHWYDVHGYQTPSECKICKIPFTTRGQGTRHRLEVHGHICKVCGSSFKKSMGLEDHTFNAHGVRMEYPCHVCGFKVQRHRDLMVHISKQHGPNFIFACSVCNHRYISKEECEDHEEIHNDPVSCEFCKQEFPRKSVLLQHKREVHPTEHAELKRKAFEEKKERRQQGGDKHRFRNKNKKRRR